MFDVIKEQPIAGSKETFSWLTDIIESENGSEHRIQLRSAPRVNYELKIFVHPSNRNVYLNAIRNNLTKEWIIPDWLSAVYIGRIEYGSDTIENVFSQNVGDKFFIYQNFKKNEVNEWIHDKKNGSTWQFGPDETPPSHNNLVFRFGDDYIDKVVNINRTKYGYKAAWMIPLTTTGNILSVNYRTSGFDGEISLNIEINSRIDYDNDEVGTTYLGLEVLHNNYGVNESSITQLQDVIDYDIGKITRIERWGKSKINRSINFYLDDVESFFLFKKFIFRRAGKLKAFWFCDDDVNIQHISFIDNRIFIKNSEDVPHSFKYIAIFHSDEIIYAKITSIDKSIITIDQIITKPILKISNLILCRFNSDSVTIEYQTNMKAQASIPIIEVFDDQYFQTS